MDETTKKIIALSSAVIALALSAFIVKRVEFCPNCNKYFNNQGGARGVCPHCRIIIGIHSMGA